MNVFSHLDAIDMRLSLHRSELANAKTKNQKEWSEHNIRMIEKEREAEVEFLKKNLGIDMSPVNLDDISDDELLFHLSV